MLLDPAVRDLAATLKEITGAEFPVAEQSDGPKIFIGVTAPGDNAPCADYDLLSRAMEAAKAMNLRAHCGAVFTSEAFYGESEDTKALQKLGVLAVEMEASALYMNAALTGKNALTICTISDSAITGESMSAEERQNSFTDMIRLGLSLA